MFKKVEKRKRRRKNIQGGEKELQGIMREEKERGEREMDGNGRESQH